MLVFGFGNGRFEDKDFWKSVKGCGIRKMKVISFCCFFSVFFLQKFPEWRKRLVSGVWRTDDNFFFFVGCLWIEEFWFIWLLVCIIPASAFVLQSASVFGSSADEVNNFRDTTGKDGLERNKEQCPVCQLLCVTVELNFRFTISCFCLKRF